MPRRLPLPARQRGLSLVELLVALVLGLVILGGFLGIYLSGRHSFRAHEGLARLQESARFAFELMAREIRSAGSSPCGSPMTANVLRMSPVHWSIDTDAGALRGGEGGAQGVATTGTGTAQHVASTDSLLVLRPQDEEAAFEVVSSHAPDRHLFMMAAAPNIESGAIALVCDGHSSALLQVWNVNGDQKEISYLDAPLNCTDRLGAVPPSCDASLDEVVDREFETGSTLVAWNPGLWFVGNTGRGTRALYRAEARPPTRPNDPAVLGTVSVEMVPGVSDMQLEYLTRNDNLGGVLAPQWVSAAALSGRWNDPAQRVVAVRISLEVQGETPDGPANTPIRRRFVSVVALRNPAR